MFKKKPFHRISGVSFGIYGSEEIRNLSIKKLTNPTSTDILGHSNYGGLYDPDLGPTKNEACNKCGLYSVNCPGHLGHIELPLPVYNPFLFSTMMQLLKNMCQNCNMLLIKPVQKLLFIYQMKLLDHSLVTAALSLGETFNVRELKNSQAGELEEELQIYFKQLSSEADFDVEELQVKHAVKCRSELIKNLFENVPSNCSFCNQRTSKGIRHEGYVKLFWTKMKSEDQSGKSQSKSDAKLQRYISPTMAREYLDKLWSNEKPLLTYFLRSLDKNFQINDSSAMGIFFVDVIPVPPSKFRPLSHFGDRVFENAQTALFSKVINDCIILRVVTKLLINDNEENSEAALSSISHLYGETINDKMQTAWIQLQAKVNSLFDVKLDRFDNNTSGGVKQILEKKTGLFRKHMMGKRVNFAARSVISPDPYIATNEIGVPMVFAKKLTYSQMVTPFNFNELKQAVINGPNKYPGAISVEMENGKNIILSDITQRTAIANQLLTPSEHFGFSGRPKSVLRHIKNGDLMLLNRQPTLHRPSIQAHKARILPGEKTLRLHYANCKAYNADFDGDEMNAHFPQSELGRAEALKIASTDLNYLVPKDGTPLAGLIQDHMVSGVGLTMRGRFFDCHEYQQLVFSALTDKVGRVIKIPPCLIKPKRLWSGKQVVSTILLNLTPANKPALNMDGKSKIDGKNWVNKPCDVVSLTHDMMDESEVVIRDGHLLVGVLDKSHYGPTPYGLVHCCYEIYGGTIAGRVLTSLAKLFTTFLQTKGFTLGVEDILVNSQANGKRKKIINESLSCGFEVAKTALRFDDSFKESKINKRLQEAHFNQEGAELKDLDLAMKSKTDDYQNQISKVIMPHGLHKIFPQNNLQLMVQSGAKGSSVNCMQISCLLGQIELEGRRPTLMLSGRTLPSFLPYDTSPRAGGFVADRFLTGIKPQEYFFHCMAGREGLVDTAVKTSRSGYLQRCIIKHLEGITVNYDTTVRDSDSSVIQFQYGNDGLDVTKTKFLQKKQIPFLINNKEAFLKNNFNVLQEIIDMKSAPKLWKKYRHAVRKLKKHPELKNKPFLNFSSEAENKCLTHKSVVNKWFGLENSHKNKYIKNHMWFPDPIYSVLQPNRNFGSMTEAFEQTIQDYLKENPNELISDETSGNKGHANKISSEQFLTLMKVYYLNSHVDPGEAVGLLAAQSIGEPSTQMTLNTFHFAGRGEMNVTLGIPRLREILMVASRSIKTPSMTIPINEEVSIKQAKKLKNKFNKVYLSNVIENIEIHDVLKVDEVTGKSDRFHTLRFNLLPHSYYKEMLDLRPSKVLEIMENGALNELSQIVLLSSSQKITQQLSSASSKSRSKPGAEDEEEKTVGTEPTQFDDNEDDISADELNDGEAGAVRAAQRRGQERDYEGEDEEIEEMDVHTDVESDLDLEVNSDGEESKELVTENKETENKETNGFTELDLTADSSLKLKWKERHSKGMNNARIQVLLAKIPQATNYKYDAENSSWCEITLRNRTDYDVDVGYLLDNKIRKTVIQQTPGLTKSFLSENKMKENQQILTTQGINILEMYKYDKQLDLNKLYTNDIHAMVRHYGIEAGLRTLIEEVRNVFAAYGIGVDYRHLSLIADYMMFEGTYLPFNRLGLESNPSPFQKMTFETTMHFLKTATVTGAKEFLSSPSARLVVGRIVAGGTGSFELLQPLH